MEKARGELEEQKADSFEESRLKLSEIEEENKRLHLLVVEANEKNKSQEQKILLLEKEIESQKAASHGGYMFVMLEDEKRNVEDQLKWKTEQFDHLEDAHEKLRSKFRSCESEWEEEKARLLQEISRLETRLDSEMEASLRLGNQLEMCKQAMHHEENRRKRLEVQVSEMKLSLENVTDKYEEAKAKVECSTVERNDGLSALRNSLRIKETLCKEMEYKAKKLEEENKELLRSLKELQESQIPKASTPPSSMAKLRSKLKNLEQTHKGCSLNLSAKEAEWCSQREKMARELNDMTSYVKTRDTEIGKLKVELEGCRASITELILQNEELSLMVQLLRSESSELDSQREDEEDASIDDDLLESKDAPEVDAQGDIEKQCEKCASLLLRIEALEALEREQLLMREELENYKNMLQQSSSEQLIMKEEAAEVERNLREELHEVSRALDVANCELLEKINEGCELELDVQVWKSKAEHLKAQIEEKRVTRRDLESSLLAQSEFEMRLKRDMDCLTEKVEEKDRMIADLLRQQIAILNKHRKVAGEEVCEENELYPPMENVNVRPAPTMKTSEAVLDDRSVLRELN